MLLGVFLALAITLSVIVLLNYGSTGAPALAEHTLTEPAAFTEADRTVNLGDSLSFLFPATSGGASVNPVVPLSSCARSGSPNILVSPLSTAEFLTDVVRWEWTPDDSMAGRTCNFSIFLSAPGELNTQARTVAFQIIVNPADIAVPAFDPAASIDNQLYLTTGIPSAIPDLTLPIATGGDGTLAYSIRPLLPAGLTLTGRILSGTLAASTAQASTAYTYRVSDTDSNPDDTDTDTLTFTIEILNIGFVPMFSSTANIPAQVYAVGTEDIGDVTLPQGYGSDPLAYSIMPTLPNGLTLTGRILTGTPTATQAAITYTYTVTDSDSNTDTIDFTITIRGNTATLAGTLTEANLDGAEVTVTLAATEYIANGLTVSHFTLTEDLPGDLTLTDVIRNTNNRATLTLSYTGEDITADGMLSVTVLASAHSGTDDLISDPVLITPNPPILITLTAEGSTVTTEGNTIGFSVNLPTGMTVGEELMVAWTADCSGGEGIISADDFQSAVCPSGTVAISANMGSSDSVSITLLDDSVTETDETLTVRLSSVQPSIVNNTGFSLSDTLEYSIADGDSTLSIFTTADSALPEGNPSDPNALIMFFVSLPDGVTAGQPISVGWELECDETSADDFVDVTCGATTGTVAIQAGGTSAAISFTINPDSDVEGRETFRVRLLPLAGFTIAIANSVATGTILDDDIAILNIDGPMSVDEGSTAFFTLSLDPDRRSLPSDDVELLWFIEGCSDNMGTDGINSFDFADGADGVCPDGTFAVSTLTAAAAGITVSISTFQDSLIEGAETFQLGIVDPSTIPILELSRSTTTINDSQEGTPVMLDVVKGQTIAVMETDDSFQFRISFADGLTADEDVTVDWAVTCGNDPPGITADDFDFPDPNNLGNFLCPSGEAIIPAMTSGVLTTIEIFNDTIVERDEAFTLSLLGVRATNTGIVLPNTTQAIYTLIDNDSAEVSLSAPQTSISEDAAAASAMFRLSLSEVDEDVTVDWAVICNNVPGITAADFTGFGGSCPTGSTTILSSSFGEGTDTNIVIGIENDDLIEGNETFTLNLTGLAMGTNNDISIASASSTATFTINDDDGGLLSVDVSGPSTVSEAGQVTFTVTLAADSSADMTDEAITVNWAVGCGNSPGITAADFAGSVCPMGSATIDAGATVSMTFTIDTADDTSIEGEESFTLTLTDPSIDVLRLGAPSTFRITDSDSGAISLTTVTGKILEGETATFRVELGGSVTADEEIGVPWSVTCGAAGSVITGDDFANPPECASGIVTISADQSSATFTVPTYDDANVEGVENFAVTLSSSLSTNIGGLVTVSDTAAVVVINDNDAALLVFRNPVPSPVDEDGTVAFPLIFDPFLPSAVTLVWRIEISLTAVPKPEPPV